MICVFDVETTGFYPAIDKIIDIATVHLNDFLGVEAIYSAFTNPWDGPPEIPEKITKLTGIRPQHLINAPGPAKTIHNFINNKKPKFLVAHNAEFDMGFIGRHLRPDLKPSVVCTVKTWREIRPELENHKLSTLCKTLELSPNDIHSTFDISSDWEGEHRALPDALRAAALFSKAVKIHGGNIERFWSWYCSIPTRMPFGKYKGEPIQNIPSGYLGWVMNNSSRADLRAEINKELEARK